MTLYELSFPCECTRDLFQFFCTQIKIQSRVIHRDGEALRRNHQCIFTKRQPFTCNTIMLGFIPIMDHIVNFHWIFLPYPLYCQKLAPFDLSDLRKDELHRQLCYYNCCIMKSALLVKIYWPIMVTMEKYYFVTENLLYPNVLLHSLYLL